MRSFEQLHGGYQLLIGCVLITLVSVTAPANNVTAFDIPESGAMAQSPSVVTCIIQQETATENSRREVAYYECLALNGAIVPSVTFIVHGQSSGDLWLRQLAGKTVDVRLEVVR